MTDNEFETLADLISRPEVTLYARLSETQVLPFTPECSAAYIRRECPHKPGTWENYPAAVQIDLVPHERITIDQLREHDLQLMEAAEAKG